MIACVSNETKREKDEAGMRLRRERKKEMRKEDSSTKYSSITERSVCRSVALIRKLGEVR